MKNNQRDILKYVRQQIDCYSKNGEIINNNQKEIDIEQDIFVNMPKPKKVTRYYLLTKKEYKEYQKFIKLHKDEIVGELETKIKRQRETKKMYKRLAKRRRIYAGHLGEVLRKRNLKIKELKENEVVLAKGKVIDLIRDKKLKDLLTWQYLYKTIQLIARVVKDD